MTSLTLPHPPASPPCETILTGKLSAHPKGFAFVHLDDGLPDVFIAPRGRAGAQHGEMVGVVVDQHADGRRSGHVVSIPDRAPEWIGQAQEGEGGLQLVALDPRYVPAQLLPGQAQPGDWLLARLVRRAQPDALQQVECVRVVGQTPDAGLINQVVITAHALPTQAFVGALPQPAEATSQSRIDLRHLPFVTIDAPHSRDLDDALWAQALPDGNLRLVVAIADVSHFVRPGSDLDRYAQERTTSVYLPGQVIHMLPPVLSQDVCSLNPDADRPCVVCDMVIDEEGQALSSSFYRATMRSHGRLTYEDVEQHLFNGCPPPSQWQTCWPSLLALKECYERLVNARHARGAMEFEGSEASMSIGHSGIRFNRHARGHAHRLVEETMVAANVQAARTLDERAKSSLYRSHGAPPQKKQDTLEALLDSRAIPRPQMNPTGLAALVRAHPYLASAIMRAQDKACYQTSNGGHFGLGLSHYAHFTSPIRRYPDLVVHRMLLGEEQPDLEWLAQRCSEGERRATLAEREAVDRLRALHLSGQVGSRFMGTIESITPMGAFVTLSDSRASGLLPISVLGEALVDLPSQIITDGNGQVWGLGDPIEVALASSDWKTNRLEFMAPLRPMPAPTQVAPRP